MAQVSVKSFSDSYVPLDSAVEHMKKYYNCDIQVDVTEKISQRGRSYHSSSFFEKENNTLILSNVYTRKVAGKFYILIESFKKQREMMKVDEGINDNIAEKLAL